VNGEERSQTARSHGHHGLSRLPWLLVTVLGGLLLATLKPSFPLDISISWNPKPPRAGTSPDRADGSESLPALKDARLEESAVTDLDPLERPREGEGQRRLRRDPASLRFANERSSLDESPADPEDDWSGVDRPGRQAGTRRLPPSAERGGDQRNRARGWGDAYEERGDASSTRDDDWTEPGPIKTSSRPSTQHTSGWEDDAPGPSGDRDPEEPRGRPSFEDGWATDETGSESDRPSVPGLNPIRREPEGLATRTDGSGTSGERARKSDPALLRAAGASTDGQPAPPDTPHPAELPRGSIDGPPPAGDPARIAQAVQILAPPVPELVPVPQTPPGSADPPVGVTSPLNTNTTAAAAAAGPQPDPSKASSGTLSAPGASPTPAAGPGPNEKAPDDPDVRGASCPSCGGSGRISGSTEACLSCGGRGTCFPGQKPCDPVQAHTVVGRFFADLYECICCPDPCYQPSWIPQANAAFFVDYARPRTVTRLRYDNLEDMTRPDRNQFWINNVTPTRKNGTRTIRNLYARLQQVYIYQEAAGARGSVFVEYPYRQINESWAPTQAGFGNINFGIKSLLFDCEMLQVAFQLRTFMPSGNFMNNLGNGQFAIDPSILTSLKLGPETYFQGQFGNWVPLGGPGGNSKLAGGIFYWFMSLNQVVCYTTPHSPLIATLEMDGWSFENGGYTPSILKGGNLHPPIPKGGGVSYFNIGPGLRQSICNRVDFGGAITWATNSAHWAQPWFRFEVRFLF